MHTGATLLFQEGNDISTGVDKSSDEINLNKNTTLLSFTDMFPSVPLHVC